MSLEMSKNLPMEPDDLIGRKVIARTNEDEPLTIGEFVGFGFHNIPKIRDDETGEIVCHMGIIVPYSEAMMRALEPMQPQEQWDWLCNISLTIKVLRKAEYPTG